MEEAKQEEALMLISRKRFRKKLKWKPWLIPLRFNDDLIGKSTVAGHLIYKCGGVDRRTVESCEQEASASGKPASDKCFAWIVDTLKAERETGISQENSLWRLESPHYQFTIIDTPGHCNYVEKMIAGTAQAHVAVFVVDCLAGMSEDAQTREHMLLAFHLGVSQIIVVLNKMDGRCVKYSELHYAAQRKRMCDKLSAIGYDVAKISFVPISGWEGENISDKSNKMAWYEGPSLLEALDNVDRPNYEQDRPLRIPIQDVFYIGGGWGSCCWQS